MAIPSGEHAADELLAHWISKSVQEKPKQMETIIRTASGNSKHSWLWSNPAANKLSDCVLRILHLPSAKGGASAEELETLKKQAGQEVFQLHSVVLAASSVHFRHKLLSAASCDEDDTTDGNTTASADARDEEGEYPGGKSPRAADTGNARHVIEEHLLAADVPAAKAVLQHMYTDDLAYSSPSQLVSILKVADKWSARDTIDACRAAFAKIHPDDLDLEVVKQVYSLEGIICDVQNFAELVAAVQSRLVRIFQEIVEVIQKPSMKSDFLQLPFAAVVALLRSPELMVDSENSVVVAANLWLTQGKGRGCSQEQRKILASVIHLAGLSPSYLCGVLPNLRWFSSSGTTLPWQQALPGPYFAEMQSRMVSPKAKTVIPSSTSSVGPVLNRSQSCCNLSPSLSGSLDKALSKQASSVGTHNGNPADHNNTQLDVNRKSSSLLSASWSYPHNGVAAEPGESATRAPPSPQQQQLPGQQAATASNVGAAAVEAAAPSAPSTAAVSASPGRGGVLGRFSRRNSKTSLATQPSPSSAANDKDSNSASAAHRAGSSTPGAAGETGGNAAAQPGAGITPSLPRIMKDQNLEIECEIDFARLRQYILDGNAGLQAGRGGFRGLHVHSETTYFRGFLWGIKLVFGFSTGYTEDGRPPTFTVTPSPCAALPPGDEGLRPLVAPVTVTFQCTMEGVGPQGNFAVASYQGASYIKPGDEHVSSIGISNFFKRVPAQHIPDSWLPFMVNDGLKLKLLVTGASVE